uniref:Uncharacterized protein n=1 Tax=Anguilla anguilla TaxID=7936 RepID=A0A0E9WMF6_ANGAN
MMRYINESPDDEFTFILHVQLEKELLGNGIVFFCSVSTMEHDMLHFNRNDNKKNFTRKQTSFHTSVGHFNKGKFLKIMQRA